MHLTYSNLQDEVHIVEVDADDLIVNSSIRDAFGLPSDLEVQVYFANDPISNESSYKDCGIEVPSSM